MLPRYEPASPLELNRNSGNILKRFWSWLIANRQPVVMICSTYKDNRIERRALLNELKKNDRFKTLAMEEENSAQGLDHPLAERWSRAAVRCSDVVVFLIGKRRGSNLGFGWNFIRGEISWARTYNKKVLAYVLNRPFVDDSLLFTFSGNPKNLSEVRSSGWSTNDYYAMEEFKKALSGYAPKDINTVAALLEVVPHEIQLAVNKTRLAYRLRRLGSLFIIIVLFSGLIYLLDTWITILLTLACLCFWYAARRVERPWWDGP